MGIQNNKFETNSKTDDKLQINLLVLHEAKERKKRDDKLFRYQNEKK